MTLHSRSDRARRKAVRFDAGEPMQPEQPPHSPPQALPDLGAGGDPRVGTVIAERYRIHSPLGEGGMGKVYAGEHVLMHKRVAIKVLHKELTALADIVKRFEREAMAAANIDHPNVAGATDFGRLADGSIFLVLEYVQGVSLRNEIAEGAFGLIRALHVARQIASALAAAHLRGIVHRDLKPENVMLVERAGDPDFVKVLDFGIAKVPIQEISDRGSIRPGQAITKIGMVFGTPEYMAPEQALGQDVDSRADQYALGVILFEMLTGQRPFKSTSAVGMLGQQLQGPPPRVSERSGNPSIPPEVDELVSKLLAAERDRRFDNCQLVVDTVETLLLGLQPSVLMRGSRPDASAVPLLPLDAIPSSRDLMLGSFSGEFSARAIGRGSSAELEPKGWLARLRAHLPRSLQRRPAQLTLALFGGLVAGASIVVSVLWVGASRKTARVEPVVVEQPSVSAPVAVAPELPTQASPTELAAARAQGSEALEGLARRYPLDAAPLVELGKLHLSLGNCATSLESVERALAVDGKSRENAEVATVLWKSVQKRECTERAFALLKGPMGLRGANILEDLATTPGVKAKVRLRAKALVADSAK